MSAEGRILGRWRLIRELGRGGMGQVWLAQHREDTPPEGFPEQAAIKILPASLTQEPGIVLRFQREMEILGKLSHPGIVTFLEATESPDNLGFAMEYVEGCSLQEVLQSKGALPWEEAVALAIQICQPLKHAHDRGVIHRDLKPSNILVKGWPDSPQVKLTDFGVASLFASKRLTATGGLVGTAETIAPEQVAGKPATKRSDLYSLGVVIYTLISGQFPFRGHLAEVLHKQRFGQHERLSRLAEDIPLELERLVNELLAKDPAARPPDAGLVARRLQVIARKEITEYPPVENPQSARIGGALSEMPRSGEGPATFVSRVVRQHLEEQNRGGLWARLMRSPWVVVPLFLGVFGALAWVLWPPRDQDLLAKGIALMHSSDPDDWAKGWTEFLEPLSRKGGPVAPEGGFEKYRKQYEGGQEAVLARKLARSADVRSEPHWYFLCAKRLAQQGKTAESRQILSDIVLAFEGDPMANAWVEKANANLVDGPFSGKNLIQTGTPAEARERLKIATSLGVKSGDINP